MAPTARPAALTILFLLAPAFRPAPVQAQVNPAMPVPGVQMVGLLINPSVQKELKLDPGQVEGAKALAARLRETMVARLKELQGVEIAERNRKLREINKALEAESKSGMAALLKDDQRKRLRQISLQDRGGIAFADPEVQDALGMSDAQRARVQSLANRTFEQVRAVAQAGGGNPKEALKKAQSLRKKLGEEIAAEFSDEQKRTWRAMLGAPFEVDLDVTP
jgi:hypothetical protein